MIILLLSSLMLNYIYRYDRTRNRMYLTIYFFYHSVE